MRWTLPLIAATVLAVSALPATARERCDAPNGPGAHFRVTISFGHRDMETQEQIDKMMLAQQGVKTRSVRRTGDGCLEAWIPNGDGSFRNEYYDPDVLATGHALKLSLD